MHDLRHAEISVHQGREPSPFRASKRLARPFGHGSSSRSTVEARRRQYPTICAPCQSGWVDTPHIAIYRDAARYHASHQDRASNVPERHPSRSRPAASPPGPASRPRRPRPRLPGRLRGRQGPRRHGPPGRDPPAHPRGPRDQAHPRLRGHDRAPGPERRALAAERGLRLPHPPAARRRGPRHERGRRRAARVHAHRRRQGRRRGRTRLAVGRSRARAWHRHPPPRAPGRRGRPAGAAGGHARGRDRGPDDPASTPAPSCTGCSRRTRSTPRTRRTTRPDRRGGVGRRICRRRPFPRVARSSTFRAWRPRRPGTRRDDG